MKLKTIVLAVAAFAAIGMFSLTLSRVFAQDPSQITISISPPVFELSANPGEQIKNSIRVTNLSNETQEIFVDKRNFTALGEEGGVDLTEEDTSYSLASWVSTDKENAVIAAKESTDFKFTVDVPGNVEPGGHFGSIVFKTKAKNLKEGQSGTAIGQEVGALLLVKIAGDIKEQARIASFKTQNGVYEKGPVIFETRTRNAGNVHLKPRGTITVHNMFGAEVAKIRVDERNVLPDAIRAVQTEWGAGGFQLGRYTANLSMVYGDEGTIITSSTSFFLFPYKMIIPLLAVIGALVFAGIRYRKRFRAAFKALAGK